MDYCASSKRMKKDFVNYFRNSFKTLSDQIKVQNFMKRNLTFVFLKKGKSHIIPLAFIC